MKFDCWQPYKTCAAFITQQENLKEPDSELKKFQDSKIFKKAIKDISKRLGFDDKLRKKQVMNIFDMCRYEQAWNTTSQCVWCAVSVNELSSFEIHESSSIHEDQYTTESNWIGILFAIDVHTRRGKSAWVCKRFERLLWVWLWLGNESTHSVFNCTGYGFATGIE